jgi:hypothetical protein
MKTFLGVTTGLLTGWIAGIATVTLLCCYEPAFREYVYVNSK